MTKQESTLSRAVPAFAAADVTLAGLWLALAEKCGVDAITYQQLSVSARKPSSLRGAREEHRYRYESAADLHHAPPSLRRLRDYSLTILASTSRGAYNVRLEANGMGAARVTASAPDAAWCREAVDIVLTTLRPHRLWYGFVHRIGYPWFFAASVLIVAASLVAGAREAPLGVAGWFSFIGAWIVVLAVLLLRDLVFPAASIKVESRPPSAVPRPLDSSG